MITIRKSTERGVADFGWLNSHHTFSFGEYHDPLHMGFGPLRVINEDRVAPGGGFPTHGHLDMEILSWVLEGGLQHRDSLGTSSVIKPGELQRMTAGTGVRHSEFNASASTPVHFLQIWIMPDTSGLAPGYEQRAFADLDGRLRLVASRDGREGSVTIHQDADLYVARLKHGAAATHVYKTGRLGWLQVARGSITLGAQVLEAGDGAALESVGTTVIEAGTDAEVLLFDLPA